MKRSFDIFLSILGIIMFLPLIIAIPFLIKLTSSGSVLYWSSRVGKDNMLFQMPKFRSMHSTTPEVATHLLHNPSEHLTSIGAFLRKTSLDELPQLYNILIGDMSFVGPRPALYNQTDLISLRTLYGINHLRPGLTGWAQVNGRDELSIPKKVELDKYYLDNQTFFMDVAILIITLKKVITLSNVSH